MNTCFCRTTPKSPALIKNVDSRVIKFRLVCLLSGNHYLARACLQVAKRILYKKQRKYVEEEVSLS
jgi:hypothetical protein